MLQMQLATQLAVNPTPNATAAARAAAAAPSSSPPRAAEPQWRAQPRPVAFASPARSEPAHHRGGGGEAGARIPELPGDGISPRTGSSCKVHSHSCGSGAHSHSEAAAAAHGRGDGFAPALSSRMALLKDDYRDAEAELKKHQTLLHRLQAAQPPQYEQQTYQPPPLQMHQQMHQQMQQMQQVHEEQMQQATPPPNASDHPSMQMPAQPPLHSGPRLPASAYASHVASPYGNPGTGQSYQFATMAPIDTPFPDRYGSTQSTPGGAWFNQPQLQQRAASGQPNPWYKTAQMARPPANGSSNSSLVSLQQCQMSWGSLPPAVTPPSGEPELPTTAEGGGATR